MIIPLERRPGSPPVHRQLVDYLRRSIEAGRVPPGARLPAIRDLARSLGVNRETVAGAYRQLGELGLAQSGVGRGTFAVAPARRRRADGQQPESRFAPALSRSAAAA